MKRPKSHAARLAATAGLAAGLALTATPTMALAEEPAAVEQDATVEGQDDANVSAANTELALQGDTASNASNESRSSSELIKQIYNLDDLKAFRASVNAGADYTKQYVRLYVDIDLSNESWTPIGTKEHPFNGIFKGNSHTISGLTINDSTLENAGLFGVIDGGTVDGLAISGANITALASAGALAGNAHTGTLSSCKVTGKVNISTNYKAGGLAGEGYATVTNCSVDADQGSTVTAIYLKGDYEGDNVGGLIGFRGENGTKTKGCSVKNLTVTGSRKVGGLIGSAFVANVMEDCTAQNVTVACNASVDYASTKSGSLGFGGLVGLFTTSGEKETTSSFKDCYVRDITLQINDEVSKAGNAVLGYISGGMRERAAFPNNFYSENLTFTGANSGENASSILTYKDLAAVGGEARSLASIGDKPYTTLQSALDAANEGDAIKLVSDVVESVTVASGKNVKLDLNGCTLSSDTDSVITNKGELSITDSTKKGKVVAEGGDGTYAIDNRGRLTINQGTFTATTEVIHTASDAVTIITDGQFSAPVRASEMPAGEYVTYKDSSSKLWKVGNYKGFWILDKDGVATYKFKVFSEALDYVEAGQTLQLHADAIASKFQLNKTMTLDLNGNKLAYSGTVTGSQFITVGDVNNSDESVVVTIKNGELTKKNGCVAAVYRAELVLDDVTVTNTGDNVETSGCGVQVGFLASGNDDVTDLWGRLTVKGDTKISGPTAGVQVFGPLRSRNSNSSDCPPCVVNVESGTIEGGLYGLVGNGLAHGTEFNISGGTIKGTNPGDNCGIYHPQMGTLNMTGGTVSGLVGIQMAGGHAYIKGGEVVSTEQREREAPYKDKAEGDGSVMDGAALSVVSREGWGAVTAEVTGGSFASGNTKNPAVKYYGFQKNTDEGKWEIVDVQPDADLKVSGGTYTSEVEADCIATGYANFVRRANGGVTVMKASDASSQAYGKVTVRDDSGKEVVTYYESYDDAKDAANAAGEGATVEQVPHYVAPTSYAVSVGSSERGTAKLSSTSATAGTKVTVTLAPGEGFRAVGVAVADASGKAVEVAAGEGAGEYTFKMPASKVTVTPLFAKSFSDVDYSAWYADAVDFVSARGVMNGIGGTDRFGVGETLTRAELASLLWNYAEPNHDYDADAKNATGMADVADGQWYTAAANWAVANGVVNGYDNADGSRTFGPSDPVTLEQFCAVVRNLTKGTGSADLSKFLDSSEVSGWAKDSVSWAVSAGLVNGSDEADGLYLRAGSSMPRERVAAVVANAYKVGVLG